MLKLYQVEAIELESVVDAINKHAKANINYLKERINIFELTQRGPKVYEEKALLGKKKEFLSFVFLNFKLKDEKLVPTPIWILSNKNTG